MGILAQSSLGLIETMGLTAALDAADALCKAGDVTLLLVRKVGEGRVCVLFAGELGACQASLEAGAAAARLRGELLTQKTIARPLADLDALIECFCQKGNSAKSFNMSPEIQGDLAIKEPGGKAQSRRRERRRPKSEDK